MFAYRHIIWDWNGTLFDDTGLCLEILNRLLAARGKPPVDDCRYREIFGFPVKDYYKRAGFDFSHEPFEKPAHEFIGQYETRRHECPLRAGAVEILSAISGMGARQYVLSAYEQKSLDEILGRHGLERYFECVCGLDNPYAAGKTALGENLLARLEIDRRETVLVGDTVHDYEVARHLGIGSILVAGGHNSRRMLENCGTPVYENLCDLKNSVMG